MGEKHPAPSDEVVTYVEPSRGVCKKLLIREGRIAGAILLGDAFGTPRVLQAFDRWEMVPESRADLLFSAARESKAPDVAAVPNSALVCYCNSVSKGKIVAAVEAGHGTQVAVQQATRAGTGCGACKADVRAVIEFVSRKPLSAGREV